MINKLRYATIADIGVYSVRYYEDLPKAESIEFCLQNGISYLPSKNKQEVYKFTGKDFEKQNLKEEFKVFPNDLLFSEKTLEKFKKVNHNEIRFIVDKSNNKIEGVVHIIDYNNEHLLVEFYRALFRFEHNIRRILQQKGKNNEDFLEWMKQKAEDSNDTDIDWRRRYNDTIAKEWMMKSLNVFQSFFLRDLLLFGFENKLIESPNWEMLLKVSNFRNVIAHAKDLTSHTESEENVIVYNFKNLKKFVKNAENFFDCFSMVQRQVESLQMS